MEQYGLYVLDGALPIQRNGSVDGRGPDFGVRMPDMAQNGLQVVRVAAHPQVAERCYLDVWVVPFQQVPEFRRPVDVIHFKEHVDKVGDFVVG